MSVAIPGSIVANAQSRELRTYLVGQIARSLAIFNIDEVVIYDDRSVASESDSGKRYVVVVVVVVRSFVGFIVVLTFFLFFSLFFFFLSFLHYYYYYIL